MNIKFVSIMIIIAGIFGVVTASAQRRPHDQVMKDIQAAIRQPEEDLDVNNSSAASSDAATPRIVWRDRGLFGGFETKDALDSKKCGTAAAAVGTAAQNNDIKVRRIVFRYSEELARVTPHIANRTLRVSTSDHNALLQGV